MNEGKTSRGWVLSVLILAVAVLIGALALWSSRPQPVTITILPPQPTATATDSPTPAPVTVYVTGAVARPETLVNLRAGSRVQDAVDAAGGATERADLTAVNLAARVHDGDQIHVPEAGETTALATPNSPSTVDINTATAEELEALPEVGPSLAAAIVAYREANGPFSRIEDLDPVEGIGPRLLETLAPLIRFGDN